MDKKSTLVINRRIILWILCMLLTDMGYAEEEAVMVKIEAERLPELNIPRHSNLALFCKNGELTIFGETQRGQAPLCPFSFSLLTTQRGQAPLCRSVRI